MIFHLSSSDPVALSALISGELDEAKCEVCKVRLDVKNTIIVISQDNDEVIILFGTLAWSAAEQTIQKIRSEMPGREVLAVANTEELKQAAVKIVKRGLRALVGAQRAELANGLQDYLVREWPSLTNEVFAAGRVSLTVPVPGVKVAAIGEHAATATIEDATRSLANLQAQTWIMMWIAWNGPTPERFLEHDLSSHIDRDALVDGAAALGLEMLGKIGAHPELSGRALYCLEAVRASICAASQQPNPHATEWAKQFLLCEGRPSGEDEASPAEIRQLLVSEARARETLPYEALWDAIVMLTSGRLDVLGQIRMEEACAKAGHPELLDNLLAGMRIQFNGEDPVAFALDFIKLASERLGGDQIVEVPDAVIQPLIDARDADGLERIAAAIAGQRLGDRTSEAAADAWLGARLKLILEPKRFLDRIGYEPRDWEQALPRRARTRLWLERSNHLRLIGRGIEALRVLEEAIRTGGDAIEANSVRTLERNRAVLLRETGAPDESVRILTELAEGAEGGEKIQVFNSLGTSKAFLGDYEGAEEALRVALACAKGPYAGEKPALQATLAFLLAARGSLDQLLKMEHSEIQGPAAIVAAGSGWATALLNGNELPDDRLKDVIWISEQLEEVLKRAVERGAHSMAFNAVRVLASILDVVDPERASGFWEMARNMARDSGLPPDPIVSLALAERAYQVGDVLHGRELLAETAVATEASFGGLADISRALAGSERLERRLFDVGAAVLEGNRDFSDIRLLGEMQRDTLARARSLRLQTAPSEIISEFRAGISEQLVARLAPDTGSLGVLEWVHAREYFIALLTVIDSSGTVRTEYLPAIGIPFHEAVERLTWNLSTWTRRRRDEPFDIDEWTILKSWLREAVEHHLKEGDHLIVIENEAVAGIPWHVAVAGRWTCSYASGWLSLLSLAPNANGGLGPIGVAMVPEARDSSEIESAMRASADRTKTFARAAGIDYLEASGLACNRERFSQLMGEARLVKVLCHGYVQSSTRDVAWLLGDGRGLPVAIAVATESHLAAAHRFSWRDASILKRTPDVVFSAACSSGFSHLAGVGERLGLMTGLRSGGTRSFVAPRWDVVAEDVLPVLDDALERFWKYGRLAKSVADAGAAAKHLPDWLRWSIAVEGDWR